MQCFRDIDVRYDVDVSDTLTIRVLKHLYVQRCGVNSIIYLDSPSCSVSCLDDDTKIKTKKVLRYIFKRDRACFQFYESFRSY